MDPTEIGGADHKAYCFLDRERQCRGDCVAFDTNGVRDDSGKLTSCRLLNDVAGTRAAAISVGAHFRSKAKVAGRDIPPPRL